MLEGCWGVLIRTNLPHTFFSRVRLQHMYGVCHIWAGSKFVYHTDIHFCQFTHPRFNNKCNRVWKYVWMTIIWSVWNHTNNVIFTNLRADVQEIFIVAQFRSWTWITNKYSNANFSYSDSCVCLVTCIKSMIKGTAIS